MKHLCIMLYTTGRPCVYTCEPLKRFPRLYVGRPSHLKIRGGTKMARAELSRGATDEPCIQMWRPSEATPVFCLAAIGGPLIVRTDPARRAISTGHWPVSN